MLPGQSFRIRPHLAFIVLAVTLFIYLGAKAAKEESWSGWGIFAAQTMLSNEHWVKDGFIKSRLLYIPIGYSSIAQFLDEPELRHHARGTVTGGLIGRRLYYTHYPSGYAMPYALLMKAGVAGRGHARLLSLVFSFAALALMYAGLNIISTPLVAFLSALYYAGSLMFIDFADALNNQAVDDFFRFLLVFLSLLAARDTKDRSRYARLNALLWVLYFLLAISSYDSTLFVFFWAIGLDIIAQLKGQDGRGAFGLVKRWALLASAPVLAFGLQMLQNAWYLGFSDMLMDFKGAFLSRASTGSGEGFFSTHVSAMLVSLFNMTNMGAWTMLSVFVILAIGFRVLRKQTGQQPLGGYITALAVAGASFSFVFAYTSRFFDYQGRQWAPFTALLIGASTAVLYAALVKLWKEKGSRQVVTLIFAAVMAPCLLIAWSAQASRTAGYVKKWPNHTVSSEQINFYKTLKSISPQDTVLLNIDPSASVRYPQPSPVDEFYLGGTILNFRDFEDLLRDYRSLKSRRPGFRPMVISPDRNLLEEFQRSSFSGGEIRSFTPYYYLLAPF